MSGLGIGRVAKLTAALVLAGGAFDCASAAEPEPQGIKENPTRQIVLRFPADRSMGRLTVYGDEPDEERWEVNAIGEVHVPAGKNLSLKVSQEACHDFALLAGPVDAGLSGLFFRDLELPPGAIERLSALRGVESLAFDSTPVAGDDLAQLANLKSLKSLVLWAIPVTDADVASLENLPLETLHISFTKVTDRVWKSIATLNRLQELRLSDHAISDTGFKYLRGLSELEFLWLGSLDEVSNEALGHLATLKKLKRLRFGTRGVRFNDASLAHLSKLVKLESLDLSRSPVTDKGLASLAPLKSLRALWLPDGITEKGLMHLTALRALVALDCKGVTDAGLAEIAKLPSLKSLTVTSDAVTNEGMRSLAAETKLTSLYLWYCPIDDEGLAALASLKSLNRLSLFGSRVSSDGLPQLAQFPALEDLEINGLAGDASDLGHLAKLTQLKVLSLRNLNRDGPPFDASALDFLPPLVKLTELELDDFALSDGGVQRVAALESLESFTYMSDDSRMTDDALAQFAAMPKLSQLSLRGNFTDGGLEILPTSRLLERVRIESQSVSKEAMAKLQGLLTVTTPRRWPGLVQTAAPFKRRGALTAALAAARTRAGRDYTRVLLILGDPKSSLTKRLVRTLDHPDVHQALDHYEPVAVEPHEKGALAKLVEISSQVVDEMQTPTLVVIDQSGRAQVDARFELAGDAEFIDPKPLVEFLDRHKLDIDAEALLAVAVERARLENKRVLLMQTSAGNALCRRMSQFIERHAAVFDAEYVIVPIDEARFRNGTAVMRRYRPQGELLPWMVVLDAGGAVLITSDSPGGPIGFPADEGSIGYFLHMLGSTVQRSTPEQLQQIRQALRQRMRAN